MTTTDIPTSGDLLDGDFRYYAAVRPDTYEIHSRQDDLPLSKVFTRRADGEVNLGVEGLEWAAGVGVPHAHLYVKVAPEFRDRTIEVLTAAARKLREFFWPANIPERTTLHPEALGFDDVTPGMKIHQHSTLGGGIVGVVVEKDVRDGRTAVCIPKCKYAGDFTDTQGRKWFYADRLGLVPICAGTDRAHWHPTNYTLRS